MEVDSSPIWYQGTKRNRSISPSSNKRRVPLDYTPSLYTTLPSHIVQSLHSTSPIVIAGRDRSTTPGDWVTRTEDLVLLTPDSGSPLALVGGDELIPCHIKMDSMDIDAPLRTSIQEPYDFPRDSNRRPLPSLQQARFIPPHQLPSLYNNLAGSPHSSPLSSSTTTERYNLEHDQDQNQRELNEEGIKSDLRMFESELDSDRKRTAKFTMGYRADCEKCKARVPGHYSHLGSW